MCVVREATSTYVVQVFTPFTFEHSLLTSPVMFLKFLNNRGIRKIRDDLSFSFALTCIHIHHSKSRHKHRQTHLDKAHMSSDIDIGRVAPMKVRQIQHDGLDPSQKLPL